MRGTITLIPGGHDNVSDLMQSLVFTFHIAYITSVRFKITVLAYMLKVCRNYVGLPPATGRDTPFNRKESNYLMQRFL